LNGVVKYRRGDGFVELQEVEEVPPAPDQVKIEVKVAGICGSDLHIYHDEINIPIRPPVVVGHEFSGVVVEVGAEVDRVRVGDRVTAEPSAYVCGRCRYCRTGYYNLCPERRITGYWTHGAFAEYCTVPGWVVHRLPENVDFLAGALTEPLACCVHGVIEQTGISAGDVVAIVGPGAIGLLSLQLALAEGGTVVVCGTSDDVERLRLASDLGAAVILDVETDDTVERIEEMTEGYGADIVLECSGAAPGARLALDLVRKRGKYTQMGLFGHPIEIDFERIAFKELQVTGFVSQRRPAWERALKLMQNGQVRTDALVTHELPLKEWARAFDMFERREGVKIVLRPE